MPNVIDETGNIYHKLTVIERAENTSANKARWLCHCSCGNTVIVVGSGLRDGVRKSCGCLHHGDSMNLIDEIGNVYNRLTVIERAENSDLGQAQWICRCKCGNEIIREGRLLRRGAVQSCGCLKEDNHLPDGIAAFRKLLYVYRRNAKNRELKWSLTKAQFRLLTSGNCYYCGTEPMQVQYSESENTGSYIYNGIDRLDNASGYVLDNCVPCCGMCNYAKANRSVSEFLAWVDRIHSHNLKVSI